MRPDTVCHYLLFAPMCMAIVSMFWALMFYTCGRDGTTSNRHIDDEPWRIVLPSAVCFAVICIVQVVYIVILLSRMAFHCDDLRHDFPEHRPKTCEHLIGLTSNETVAWHYRMMYYSATLALLIWLSATAIMVARVLRAPDFEVVIDKQRKVEIDPEMPVNVKDSSQEKLIFMSDQFI